jgi:hypothetical protein
MSEWWIGKDLEWSCCGLIVRFTWMDWGKPRKASVGVAGHWTGFEPGSSPVRSRSANHSITTLSVTWYQKTGFVNVIWVWQYLSLSNFQLKVLNENIMSTILMLRTGEGTLRGFVGITVRLSEPDTERKVMNNMCCSRDNLIQLYN